MRYSFLEHRSADGKVGRSVQHQIHSRHFPHLEWRVHIPSTHYSGCRHGTDALFVKMGKDCDGKCRTFCRVSTGSELIEKDEGVAVCFLKERNYVGHM